MTAAAGTLSREVEELHRRQSGLVAIIFNLSPAERFSEAQIAAILEAARLTNGEDATAAARRALAHLERWRTVKRVASGDDLNGGDVYACAVKPPQPAR